MVSKALRTVWTSTIAAGLSFAFIAAGADDAEAKKRKRMPAKNKAEISHVLSAQNKAKAVEVLGKSDLSRDDIRALQRALGNAGKADGLWGKKTAKAVHTFVQKLSAEEQAKLSPRIAERLKPYGFIVTLPANDAIPSPQVAGQASQGESAPEPAVQFAPGIPWDDQIATLDRTVSEFLVGLMGEEEDGLFKLEDLEALKQYYLDLGAMAKMAKDAMGKPDPSNRRHQELSRLYDHYIRVAEKAQISRYTNIKDKYPYVGLPDATMEFLKGQPTLAYRVSPAMISDLIKYGQGPELSALKYPLTKYGVRFAGFDTLSHKTAAAPLPTQGEKVYETDPYSKEFMESLGEEDAAIVRQLYEEHKGAWSALVAGQPLPDYIGYKTPVCRITLSPGHGRIVGDNSYDSGAVGANGMSETSADLPRLTQAIALTKAGCQVSFTRFPGYALPLTTKTGSDPGKGVGLEVQPVFAIALGANLMITSHYDYSFNPQTKGSILFFNGASETSRRISEEYAARTGAKVRARELRVLDWSDPRHLDSIFVEESFVTNAEELAVMTQNSTDLEAARAKGGADAQRVLDILKDLGLPYHPQAEDYTAPPKPPVLEF